jgi:hypothetical protein
VKPHRKPPQKFAPTVDDVWAAETNEKCARAIATWLKGTVNTARPINTLKLEELKAMAENVVSIYLVEVSQRVAVAPTREERERAAAILS